MLDKNKKLLFKIILALFSIFLFLVFFEIMLRVVHYPVYGFQAGLFESDPIQGYFLSENYTGKQSISDGVFDIHTNSQRMRDVTDYSLERKPGTKRILIIGDSYSFGNGANVEDSYVGQLRSFLPGREIVNLGVPGYGINNEYISFIQQGSTYNADLIVLQFALNDWGTHQLSSENGRDIVDPAYSLTTDKNGFLIEPSESKLRSVHLFFITHSKAYSFFYTKSRLAISPIVSRYWKSNVPIYFRNSQSQEYQEAIKGYDSILAKLKAQTNTSILILVGPFKEDVVSSEKIKENYNLDYFTDTNRTKADLESLALKNNLSILRVDAQNSTFFLQVDGHWSQYGNSFVAKSLAKKIIEIGL